MFAQYLVILGCILRANALVETNAPLSASRFLELRSLLLNPSRRQVIVDQGFKDDAISSHNTARSIVSPAATNMHTAVWNEDLALTAQNYADKCLWAHNPNRASETQNKVWSPSSVGENLYWNSASLSDRDHMKKAVELWDDEKQYYDYNTGACSTPPCGHYTQVVWHNSAHVGCGIKYCSSIIIDGVSKSGTVVVCNYGAAGNYVGQKPYSTDPAVTPCTNNPCLHSGTCTASGSSYSCSCTSAYTGVNCHLATVCQGVSCQNGGTCTPSADGTTYTCSCAPGFTGSSCQTAVPCQPQPCQNGGTCTESGSTYTCSCQSGFAGTNCETALTTGQFECGFESGFCGFSQDITSFDWRRRTGSTPSSGTGPSAASEGQYYAYTEVSGSWSAGSNAVLTSDVIFASGTRCLKFDYNMYGSNIGQLDVLAGNTVIWTLSGDQGNQWTSVELQTSALAQNKLSFKGTFGGGFRGDIAIDNIVVSPGSCSSPCATQPCLNGGTCSPSGSSYTCSCTSSFMGTNCEQEKESGGEEVSPCASQPCNNGGTCTVSGSSFTCTCVSPFTGTTCNTQTGTISTLDCGFESGYCGFTQLTNDNLDFTRTSGGPVSAFSGSYYVYINNPPGGQGQFASMESPTFSVSGDHCIEFGFNIQGNGYIQLASGGSTFFNMSPFDTSGWWYTYRITVSQWYLDNKKLLVKAVLGSTGYVAIDDISVTSGTCPSFRKREFGPDNKEERLLTGQLHRESNGKPNSKNVETRRLLESYP